jgi:hypothetical protein
MDTVWAVVTGENRTTMTHAFLTQCMSVIPQSDQFSTPSADSAQSVAHHGRACGGIHDPNALQ